MGGVKKKEGCSLEADPFKNEINYCYVCVNI